METEAKFSFRDRAAFEAWRVRSTLGPFVLGPEHTKDVVDTYVDGAAQPCRNAGYACRIRFAGGRAVATLKSLADTEPGGQPGVRRREELEVDLAIPDGATATPAEGPLPDWQQPGAWPRSEARALAVRLLGDERLRHLATLRQVRYERDVLEHDRRLAEFTLDHVRFDNGRPEMFELEVELGSSGSEDELHQIVAALATEHDFEPEVRSKLQRALEGTGDTGDGRRAALALRLFDATAGLHQLSDAARRVLLAAPQSVAAGEALRPDAPYAAALDLLRARPEHDVSDNERALLDDMLSVLASREREGAPPTKQRSREAPSLRGERDERGASLTHGTHVATVLAELWSLARSLASFRPREAELTATNVAERRLTLYITGQGATDAVRSIQATAEALAETLDVRVRIEVLELGSRAPVSLRFDQPLADAGRTLLAALREAMLAAEPGMRAGDEEALHDMRVAVRRMRTLMRLLRRAYPGHAARPLARGLKRLGDRLGAVRDLDVLIARVALESQALADREGIDDLFAAWRGDRDTARTALIAFLDGHGYTSMLRLLDDFVASSATDDRGAARVCDVLPGLAWRQFSTIRAHEPTVADADLPALHELRKDAKRLRYVLEFFRPLLDGDAGTCIERIVALQDALGALHDAAVLLDLLDRRAAGPGSTRPAGVALLYDLTLISLAEHRRGFESLWPDVHRRGFRRRLAATLASV